METTEPDFKEHGLRTLAGRSFGQGKGTKQVWTPADDERAVQFDGISDMQKSRARPKSWVPDQAVALDFGPEAAQGISG